MIKISERFYINATSSCYILQEKTKIQNQESKNLGKEVFRDLGYYTTIEDCIKSVLKKKTREFISKETENTLVDLKNFIEKEDKFLKELKLNV